MNDDKVFVGVSRPPISDLVRRNSLLICVCGTTLYTYQLLNEHWQQGHFDTPLYVTVDEALRAKDVA